MLPKERRIPKEDFPYILKSGTKRNSPHFLLCMAKNNDILQKTSKFSFSVSKKVAKTAVIRNKLRRRGYSVISRHIITINPEGYFMFVFKQKSEEMTFNELEKEILGLLAI